MTLQKIEHFAKIAPTYDLDLPRHNDGFGKNVFYPVADAILRGNLIVIKYNESCDKKMRKALFSAVAHGALCLTDDINEGIIREGYERIITLHRSICEEIGIETDFGSKL